MAECSFFVKHIGLMASADGLKRSFQCRCQKYKCSGAYGCPESFLCLVGLSTACPPLRIRKMATDWLTRGDWGFSRTSKTLFVG